MKKKSLSVLLSAAVAAGTLMGGSGSVIANAASEEEYYEDGPTISVMTWAYADRTPSIDKWIADCKEKFNITIDLQNVPTDNYAAILKTKMASDDLPDIVNVHMITESFDCENVTIDENTFLDISELENIADYSESIRESVSRNGKIYYMPESQNTLGVLYNKAVFEEHGYEIPTNKTEYIGLMDQMKEDGITPLAGSFGESWSAQIIPFIAYDQYVTLPYPEIPRKLYDSATNTREMKWTELEQAEAVLGLANEWVEAGYFTEEPLGSDATVACQMLATGQAAMFITGNWEYSVAQASAPEGTEIGMFALPLNEEGEEMAVPVQADGGLCINSKSENLEAAKTALNYYLSAEIQEATMKDMNGLSTNTKVVSTDAFVQEMADFIEKGTPVAGGLYGNNNCSLSRNTSFVIDVEMQSLAGGLETPQEFYEKLDAAMEEVLNK